jgi:hypothetical protein
MRLPAAAGSAGNETWAGDRGGRVFLIPHSLGWLLGRFTVGRRESRYRCHGALHSEFTTVMGWNLPSVGQHPAGSGGCQISRPINQDSWELRCCQLLREGLIVGVERSWAGLSDLTSDHIKTHGSSDVVSFSGKD